MLGRRGSRLMVILPILRSHSLTQAAGKTNHYPGEEASFRRHRDKHRANGRIQHPAQFCFGGVRWLGNAILIQRIRNQSSSGAIDPHQPVMAGGSNVRNSRQRPFGLAGWLAADCHDQP
jgi:hypothetical protein